MGVADAFLNVERQENKSRSVKERINDFEEFHEQLNTELRKKQA